MTLPHPGHGHVVLGQPSPVLFYPISDMEVRCLGGWRPWVYGRSGHLGGRELDNQGGAGGVGPGVAVRGWGSKQGVQAARRRVRDLRLVTLAPLTLTTPTPPTPSTPSCS